MSDSIVSFIKSHRSLLGVVVIFLVGLLLVVFPAADGEGSEAEESDAATLSAICSSVAGVGECEVMISYSPSGEVAAVAVICDGADTPAVRAALTDMISSLYGIGSNRISILKAK